MPDFIYGLKPILSALKAEPSSIRELLISRRLSDPQTSLLLSEAKKKKVKYTRLPRKALNRQAGTDKHQGVVAVIDGFRYASLEEVLESHGAGGQPFWVALDEIQDPRNLGAIIRCVNAFGGQGVILHKDRCVSMSPAAIKTSAGAASFTPVVRVVNLVGALKNLKQKGYWLLGLDAKSEKEIYELDLNVPLVIIVGSEGKGMRRLVKEQCDFLAGIPMFGNVDSLNASAAVAVTISEVVRQRISGSSGNKKKLSI